MELFAVYDDDDDDGLKIWVIVIALNIKILPTHECTSNNKPMNTTF